MNTYLATISFPYRLLISLGLLFLSVLLASYKMYKKREEIIEKQKNTLKQKQSQIDTLQKQKEDIISKVYIKQEIRSFFEADNEILKQIDNGEKEITIKIDTANQARLMQLAQESDFHKYLSFEEMGSYLHNCKQITGYILYPKDALRK